MRRGHASKDPPKMNPCHFNLSLPPLPSPSPPSSWGYHITTRTIYYGNEIKLHPPTERTTTPCGMGKDNTETMVGSFLFRGRQPTRRAYASSLSQSVPAQTAGPTQSTMTHVMRRAPNFNRQGMRMRNHQESARPTNTHVTSISVRTRG
ncbi:unnamed protein product, partial [Ectocarpus sp. 13 AM-2016]